MFFYAKQKNKKNILKKVKTMRPAGACSKFSIPSGFAASSGGLNPQANKTAFLKKAIFSRGPGYESGPAKNISAMRRDAYSFFFQSSAPVGHSLTHAPQSTQ